MHPLPLFTILASLLKIAKSQEDTDLKDGRTCIVRPCTFMGPPNSAWTECGATGNMPCGSTGYYSSSRCSCPAPQICYRDETGEILIGPLELARGYCLGRACEEPRPATPGSVPQCGSRQKCVYKQVGFDHWPGGKRPGMVPVESAKGRCLSGVLNRRCGIWEGVEYRCPSGWSCVRNLREGWTPEGELGYCSHDSFNWSRSVTEM
jgi:hypothetical protein